jgi:hypothetical protein
MANEMPGVEGFYNFLQVAVADKIYGGKMDPVEGAGWRTGADLKGAFDKPLGDFNLKDVELTSGGQSKEAIAEKLGIAFEDTVIDTVKYDDALNYEFVVGSKTDPGISKVMKSEGTSNVNPNLGKMDHMVDEYSRAFLKADAEKTGAFGSGMFDERKDKYDDVMSMLRDKLNKEGGMKEMWDDPSGYWSETYQKYAEAFGSK